MYLNLAMIDFALEYVPIDIKVLDPNVSPGFSTAVIYDEQADGSAFMPDRLYIARGSELPENPVFKGWCSLASIGTPPDAYLNGSCDIICFSSTMPLTHVLNAIQACFRRFDNWLKRLYDCRLQPNSMELLGDLYFEMLGNPVGFMTSQSQVLFNAFDDSRPGVNSHLLKNPKPGSFMEEDEERIMYHAAGFSETFSKRGVALYPRGTYRYNSLYYNLYEDNQYLGRLLSEDVYRPFTDNDYALLKWMGDYLKSTLIADGTAPLSGSHRMDEMIRSLIYEKAPYQPHHDEILRSIAWAETDEYRCYLIVGANSSTARIVMTNIALWLTSRLVACYVALLSNAVLVVFNITQAPPDYRSVEKTIVEGAQRSSLHVGCSTRFRGFSNLQLHYEQARRASEIYTGDDKASTLKRFDDLVLRVIAEDLGTHNASRLYDTYALNALYEYDQTNGSELVATLYEYFACNLNAAQAIKQLHIARSTFLYRLRRIKEITGIDIKNHDTRLYWEIIGLLRNEAE